MKNSSFITDNNINDILNQYGIIDEENIEGAKRLKGQEYQNISATFPTEKKIDSDGNVHFSAKKHKDGKYVRTLSNKYSDRLTGSRYGTITTGKGGILDSVAQTRIGDLDVEKEKAILESKNIIEEYVEYLKGNIQKAFDQYSDISKSQLEKRMIEDIKSLQSYGIDSDTINTLVLNNYFGLDNILKPLGYSSIEDAMKDKNPEKLKKIQDCIRKILQLRLRYVDKTMSLLAKMIKCNYKMLGLSEEQANIYIDGLNSNGNDSVKTAENVKSIIEKNADQFAINGGEGYDFRKIGLGCIFGPSGDNQLNFASGLSHGGGNKGSMMTLIQHLTRYDAIVIAHGGNFRKVKGVNPSSVLSTIRDNMISSTHELRKSMDDGTDEAYIAASEAIYFINSVHHMLKKEEVDKIDKELTNIVDRYLNDIKKLSKDGDPKKVEKLFLKISKDIGEYMYEIFMKKENEKLTISSSSDFTKENIKKSIPCLNKNKDNIQQYFASTFGIRTIKNLFTDSKRANKSSNLRLGTMWYCQPTRTLKGGPFDDVNDVVRQLIKEGFKKIAIEDCNPGGHKLSKDIMETDGIYINHSDFSNYVESSDIDNDLLPIFEIEDSLKSLAMPYDIDYDDNKYLIECIEWIIDDTKYIEEGVIDTLKEFVKKIVGAIVGIFKRIVNFIKLAFTKIKELFFGTKEKPKDIDTKFEKPIETPLIDVDSKSVKKVSTKDRKELEKQAEDSCNKIAKEIKNQSSNQSLFIKSINEAISKLENYISELEHSTPDTNNESFEYHGMFVSGIFNSNYRSSYVNEAIEDDNTPNNEDENDDDYSLDTEENNAGNTEDENNDNEGENDNENNGDNTQPETDTNAEDTGNDNDDYSLDIGGDNETSDNGADTGNDNNNDIGTDGGDNDDYTLDDIGVEDDGNKQPADNAGDGETEGQNAEDGGAEAPNAGNDNGENDDYDINDGGEGEDNNGGAGDNDDTDDGGMDTSTSDGPEDELVQVPNLKDVEKQLFDQLTPEQQKIKITELKTNFANLYEKCANILELISNSNPGDDNIIKVFDYVSKTVTDLQSHLYYYITNTFDTKSYIENDAQFKQFLAILGTIKSILDEISPKKEEQLS